MRVASYKRLLVLLLTVLASILIGSGSAAQPAFESIPRVRMVIDDYDYMISLFPDDYPSRAKAVEACSTIAAPAESLKTFWDQMGGEILGRMSEYAGISWVEPEFDIYIVKYYPDYACHRPMTIPLEGRKNGHRIVAIPGGLTPYITLFQQLAKRLLEQASMPGGSPYYISGHPLMEKTTRRFDNLANLLALQTLGEYWNIDSVLAVFRSDHWRRREPGQGILFDHLWGRWTLSAENTLATLIASEPYGSALVSMTRPPTVPKAKAPWSAGRMGPPTGGKLGISVTRDRSGYYRVVKIDTLKLAYLSGLRTGDLIRTVEGTAPKNVKDLVTLLLDHLDQGVQVNIMRDGLPEAVIIYPWEDIIIEP